MSLTTTSDSPDTSDGGSAPRSSPVKPTRINRFLLPIIALACGVTVMNIYLGQPLLTLISDGLQVSRSAASWIATLGQLGYGLGLLLILPLGDAMRRRPLLITLIAGTVASLIVAATSPSLPVLLIAVLFASALTIIPQLLIPLASSLAPPQQRAQVVGIAFGGLFAGIVVSRAFGGLIGEHAGWRTVYVVAAIATAVIGGITVAMLPANGRPERVGYVTLLRSLGRLLRTERALRQSSLVQTIVFATFSLYLATLVFLLTGEPYRLDAGTAGLLGLVGLTGVVVAPFAGRVVDKVGPLPTAGLGVVTVLLSTVFFAFGQQGLPFALVAFAILTAGVPAAQVANQSRVLAAKPEAANRMNTVYLVLAFIGSSIGAALGGFLYSSFGWNAVSVAGIGLMVLALLAWLGIRRGELRRA